MIDTENMTPEEVEDLYARVCDMIHQQSFGYTHNTSAPGISLIKRLFTVEEAAYAVHMPLDTFFTATEFGEIIGCHEGEADQILDNMSHHGCCFRTTMEGKRYYRAYPMIPGIIEPNAVRIPDEPEIGRDLIDAFQDGWMPNVFKTGIPFLRTIPVDASLVEGELVMPEDSLEEIYARRRRFCAVPCTCRLSCRAYGFLETGVEDCTCIQTDDWADYYIGNGSGKEVTREEALAITKRAIEKGCCLEICNSQNSEIICHCQKDTCAILMGVRAFPPENIKDMSHYRVVREEEKCTKCGKCAQACVINCIGFGENGETYQFPKHCYGCGQCVKHCEGKALKLVAKNAEEITPFEQMPVSVFDAYEAMEDWRRKYGNLKED